MEDTTSCVTKYINWDVPGSWKVRSPPVYDGMHYSIEINIKVTLNIILLLKLT